MTYTGHVIPLTLLVDYIFYYLTKDTQLILSSIKYNVLKDMICTAPQIFDVTFNRETMINDVVKSGMLDKRAKLCPNMFGLKKKVSKLTGTRYPVVRHDLRKCSTCSTGSM